MAGARAGCGEPPAACAARGDERRRDETRLDSTRRDATRHTAQRDTTPRSRKAVAAILARRPLAAAASGAHCFALIARVHLVSVRKQAAKHLLGGGASNGYTGCGRGSGCGSRSRRAAAAAAAAEQSRAERSEPLKFTLLCFARNVAAAANGTRARAPSNNNNSLEALICARQLPLVVAVIVADTGLQQLRAATWARNSRGRCHVTCTGARARTV